MSANLHFTPHRSIWIRERSSHWWEHIALHFSRKDWLGNFRMSRQTFTYICGKLRHSIERKDTNMRKAVTMEKRIAMALWFLATGADFRTIAHLFGVSKSIVCITVKEVCHTIVRDLLPEYIRVPTGRALKRVIQGFKQDYGFPQCAGAVDGTHIPIQSPPECPADYYNRKGWHSIIMQGVVDNKGLFMDINVGWPGRVHDARVFCNSTFYYKGQNNILFPDWRERVHGVDVPIVVLGDPAYPLLSWCMKAFPDTGSLSPSQRRFNYCLSKARVIVEHSYGKLKGRWRCLLKRLDVTCEDVPELVAACSVLHNVCEIHGDAFDEEWLIGVDEGTGDTTSSNSPSTMEENALAVDIREALMSHFSQ